MERKLHDYSSDGKRSLDAAKRPHSPASQQEAERRRLACPVERHPRRHFAATLLIADISSRAVV
jgi:hypothetical protein